MKFGNFQPLITLLMGATIALSAAGCKNNDTGAAGDNISGGKSLEELERLVDEEQSGKDSGAPAAPSVKEDETDCGR